MIQPSPVIDFIALCVHSSEMGIVYVKNGEIYDRAHLTFNKQDMFIVESYFEKVDYALAFNIGIHRSNLKKMLEDVGLPLPDKKYVCVYNWAKQNLGTTTFTSVRNFFGIKLGSNAGYGDTGWHMKDYVINAEMVAEASIMMQESCGLVLADSVSGVRQGNGRQQWLNKNAIKTFPDIDFYPENVGKGFFLDKRIMIVGDFIFYYSKKKVVSQLITLGSVCQSSLNSKTTTIILCSNIGTSKLEEVKGYIKNNADLTVIHEGHLIGNIY